MRSRSLFRSRLLDDALGLEFSFLDLMGEMGSFAIIFSVLNEWFQELRLVLDGIFNNGAGFVFNYINTL